MLVEWGQDGREGGGRTIFVADVVCLVVAEDEAFGVDGDAGTAGAAVAEAVADIYLSSILCLTGTVNAHIWRVAE